jgi:hypothetical protein
MIGIAEQILRYTSELPEGEVLSAKGLLHLGSRAAIDQALSRLHRSGELLRVGRGLYVAPVRSRFGKRAPKPEKVMAGLAAATGETVAPSGAASANALGLTTQVPVRPVYLTSGRSRKIHLGRQVVELKHAPKWQLNVPAGAAGEAVRALAWLGPKHAPQAAATLKRRLPLTQRKAIVSSRSRMPSWMAETVSHTFREEAAGVR